MTRYAHATPVCSTAEIRRVETQALAAPDPPPLMERAGLAGAELARELAQASGKQIAVIAGPGNNGGDAFVLARHLARTWFKVNVHFAGNADRLSPDAAAAYAAWQAAGGQLADALPPPGDCALVVDGLFGIGLAREITGRHAELIDWMNRSGVPVLALDMPSGIDSDTGEVLGSAVRAAHTITFIAMKPGLLTLEGPEHAGELHVASLGLDAAVLGRASGAVIGPEILASVLPPRRANTHKGDYGAVGIVGGAEGMVGAALLAGRAALKLGAGRVYVGLAAQHAPTVDPVQPELMLSNAAAVVSLAHLTALAVGPGLGQSDSARALLATAIGSRPALVLDADALNLLAADPTLRAQLARRAAPTLLTPHPAEAARLLGTTTLEVQHDRCAAALEIARVYGSAVVLKGAGSVCAWPDGRWAINTSGNPGLASAGMGDVLTGVLAALLAQRAEPGAALEAGVYLHGAAADRLIEAGVGPAGLTASEVIDAARDLLNG